MIDRDKTRAEIETRLTRLGETINTLRQKAGQQENKFEQPMNRSLDAIDSKREEVRHSLQEMETLDEEIYASTVEKLRSHLDDIDGSLRQALSHFK